MNDTPTDFSHHETPINLPANRSEPEDVSDAMAELLGKMDFDYVFLLPAQAIAGFTTLVNHNRNLDPKIVLATSELSAASMAHPDTPRPPTNLLWCILHDLVGLMNGSMGLYNAYCDRTPVLFLGGAGPLDPDQRRFIEWNHSASTQADIIKDWVKWTDEPPTGNATLKSIVRGKTICETYPPGPVYVSMIPICRNSP